MTWEFVYPFSYYERKRIYPQQLAFAVLYDFVRNVNDMKVCVSFFVLRKKTNISDNCISVCCIRLCILILLVCLFFYINELFIYLLNLFGHVIAIYCNFVVSSYLIVQSVQPAALWRLSHIEWTTRIIHSLVITAPAHLHQMHICAKVH